MDYKYPTIPDLALAVEHGLLTKAEARAVALEMFPPAKRLNDAKQLLAAEDQ